MSATLLEYGELLESVNGSNIGGCEICDFTTVQTDSRFVREKSLFVPLIGTHQDGHAYIPQALDNGASVVFVSNSERQRNQDLYRDLQSRYPHTLFVAVDDTLRALQDAAEAYAAKKCRDMIRVSITGSSGKTTTKEMLVSVCKAHFGGDMVAYTKGNFNSETGLPLAVFTVRGDEKICVLEMGMNRKDEIGEISKVFKSQYGIITNIGSAHIGILGSRENIAMEKRRSFDYIPADGAVFVPEDDDFADFCTENVRGKIVRYGKISTQKNYGVRFLESMGLRGSRFCINDVIVSLPLPGDYNYMNALAVVSCAKELGIPDEAIKIGLESMGAIPGRMESVIIRLENGKSVTIIQDCYNANCESMSKAIEFCGSLENPGRKIFVLADMKELGSESEAAHKSVGEKIAANLPDYVYLAGQEMKSAFLLLNQNKNVFYYDDTGDAVFERVAAHINSYAQDGDVILLKGSHSMGLENLVPHLEGRKS